VNSELGTSINVGVSGRYWVTVTDGTCTVTDTTLVLFNSFLIAPTLYDVKLCKNQPVGELPVYGEDLHWYTGPVGGVSTAGKPTPSVIDTGRVTYWFSQTIKGCESPRLPMLVRVLDRPKFELGDAYIIPCGTAGVTMQVVDDHESDYRWSTGSTAISIVAPGRGLYSLYAENMCGNYSDTARAVECEDRCVQFPTAFSPNGDGSNDLYRAATFCPVPTYRLVIYNRNGEMVFRTSDPNAGWNGYFRGKEQPMGAYVYQAEFYDFVLKNTFTQKGTITLVK
jgi:gliding motility-associated-like protein